MQNSNQDIYIAQGDIENTSTFCIPLLCITEAM